MSTTFINRAQAAKVSGVSYLGGVNHSAKIVKNAKKGVSTFILYLAPYNLSGRNVCPMATKDCINACLNESGQNRMDKKGRIDNARIVKTNLFYTDRPFFMKWMVEEIRAKQKL